MLDKIFDFFEERPKFARIYLSVVMVLGAIALTCLALFGPPF